MSTSETVDFEVGTCPCGNGQIVKSVTTQDNPWSSADIAYYNGCNKCAKDWRVQGRSLVSEPEATQARTALNKYWKAQDNLSGLIAPLIDNYFEEFLAPSMAAEHREMLRLGIANSDIRNYRKSRNAGKAFSAMCAPLQNPEWVNELVSTTNLQGKYSELTMQFSHNKAKKEAADAAVKHFYFSG